MTVADVGAGGFEKVKKWWARHWGSVALVGSPVVLGMLPLIRPSQESKCAFVITVMAVYWITDVVPMPVTALIPVFAYPLLDILSTAKVTEQYLRGTIMMFLGGLTVAAAVEYSKLHKRIALFVILKVGQSPRRLLFGFMSTTMFLSMWISNTAATAMMVPIVEALLQELLKDMKPKKSEEDDQFKMASINDNGNEHNQNSLNDQVYDNQAYDDDKDTCEHDATNGATNITVTTETDQTNHDGITVECSQSIASTSTKKGEVAARQDTSYRISTMFMLGTAYAANVGGTAFPTGTGPNLVLWGLLDSSFSKPTSVNFATWMAFNVPVMLVCVALCGLVLDIMFCGWGKYRKIPPSTREKEDSLRAIVQKSYDGLGKMTFHELAVALLFLLLVLLWVFRSPGFVTGWADLLDNHNAVGNATPAILVVFLMFVVPANPQVWPFKKSDDDSENSPAEEEKINGPNVGCLTWDAVETGVPWGLILLMGGGFAMAEGASASGLSVWIGQQLKYLDALPHYVIVIIIVIFAAFLTEVVSNMTTANIFIPVVRDLALGIGMNPIFLMLPVTVACSYALMMPVSNPPNAIVFNACPLMSTTDMMKAGVIVKVICLTVLLIFLFTMGVPLFQLDTLPEWAES